MFQRLFILEWKAFFRSANIGKSIAVRLLLAFLALYFLVTFLFLGFALHPILSKAFPDEEPIRVVNSVLLVWILGELLMRFMLQSLPVINIKPLLVQNIRRGTIVHYLLTKSVFSAFNLLSPILFIPFALVNISASNFSTPQVLGWLLTILALVLVVNFLNFTIQKKLAGNLKTLIPFIAIATLLFLLDYFNLFSISAPFGQFFDSVLLYPYLCLIPTLLLVFVYRLNYRYLKANLYLDTVLRDRSNAYKETDLSWTNKFGAVSPFLQLDMKLIWRNKRPRSTVTLSFIFLLYGLIFYTNPTYAESSFLIFVGVFMTGIFVINFGQFIPAWDSSYFSMLMTQDIPMRLYLESKAMLMYLSIAILALLSTPYIYFGWSIFFMNMACAIYNIGINVPLLLYFGSYNKKRIDLEKTQFFNYQGTGAAQWIVSIPLFVIPIVLWLAISTLLDRNSATIALALLGIVGLLLKQVFMAHIVKAYQKHKHVMINGFKQQQS